jgi:hypothetical protein
LRERGATGAEDLGRFVTNVEFFRPSELDKHAAMPVLLELLPTFGHQTHPRRGWPPLRA